MDGLRWCNSCGTSKPLDKFRRNKGRALGRAHFCSECCRTYERINRPNDSPSRGRIRRNKVDYCDHPDCVRIDRQVVLERGDFTCGICGDPIDGEWHMDHIIPVSKKGLHCYDNLQPSHPVCNLMKGDTILAE